MTIEQATAAKIWQYLTPPEGQHLYAVLDGASIPGLREKLRNALRESFALIPGELGKELADAAPYVVELVPGSVLARWLVNEGWGEHWGVFALSAAEKLEVREHLRALFEVQGPDGRELFFRFYDPRVLRAYLPTCTESELKEVFGPMTAFVMESEDPEALIRFQVDKGSLSRQEVVLLARANARAGVRQP